MPEPHIEVIMNLTSDMFETDSNALQILPQELLDLKHLHNYKSSVNCVGQQRVLSVQDNMNVWKWEKSGVKGPVSLSFQSHALKQHYLAQLSAYSTYQHLQAKNPSPCYCWLVLIESFQILWKCGILPLGELCWHSLSWRMVSIGQP